MGGQRNRGKDLTKRQFRVIDDLFEGNLSEIEAMRKHKVSRRIYRRWLEDEKFVDELMFRVESAKRQSDFLIAKYTPIAAVKLVDLTKSEKEETSRKACLDVIAHPVGIKLSREKKTDVGSNISSETAERLLGAMARESN